MYGWLMIMKLIWLSMVYLFLFSSSNLASTVSTCSFTSNVSSGGEPASPSIPPNPPSSSSLYSTVEKNSNKQRKTIHLGEGVSIVTATAEKRKKVEDLYAKVRKKRVNLTISTTGSDDYSTYQVILLKVLKKKDFC